MQEKAARTSPLPRKRLRVENVTARSERLWGHRAGGWRCRGALCRRAVDRISLSSRANRITRFETVGDVHSTSIEAASALCRWPSAGPSVGVEVLGPEVRAERDAEAPCDGSDGVRADRG